MPTRTQRTIETIQKRITPLIDAGGRREVSCPEVRAALHLAMMDLARAWDLAAKHEDA